MQVIKRGLSPRMRGNPQGVSIRDIDSRVYPRACGGTGIPLAGILPAPGLSPRMRGNHFSASTASVASGSIPAHAGEPHGEALIGDVRGVYPRACGGTRARAGVHESRAGSIPAHAGEPRCLGRLAGASRVYPRACGGTVITSTLHVRSTGLSPRMRGNHSETKSLRLCRGSIPAHAGEPPARRSPSMSRRVYPRACGGTAGLPLDLGPSRGLSPRMRGNRHSRCPRTGQAGSIPAHAGEP